MGKNQEHIRAKEYVKNLIKTKSKKEAREKAGYSKSYALSGQIDKTEAVQREKYIFLSKLEKERNRIVKALENKNLDEERYETLLKGLDTIQKHVTLLSGGPTERQELNITFDASFQQSKPIDSPKIHNGGSVEPS